MISKQPMDYLSKTYGLQTELNAAELIVQTTVAELLQLIDRNLQIWQVTTSKVTINALIESHTCVVGLLNAIRFVEQSHFRLTVQFSIASSRILLCGYLPKRF